MLDSETKRRIDSARDILVGKVPDPKSQVEQITIALIYKFMDDMDKQSIEMGGKASFFKGEFKKYGWGNIFDPRLGGVEMLNLYGEAITRMSQNANLPELFRNIFKNAYLPYRDPETLKLFLKTINEFTYDHSEKLGDAFEYLLSVLGSQGDAGQFRTPRHIIDFMVQVVDPKKNETVLDPACGTAGFLISAYKHIVAQALTPSPSPKNGRGGLNAQEKQRLYENFTGYDISPDMVRLSLVNLYLHGFVKPQIHEYDSLASEDRWNEYADVILANPPFMSPKGGITPHKRFSVQSRRNEVLFVDYIAEHLTPNGRAAFIVPEGIIFQTAGAYQHLRKYLIDKNYIWAVVSLPAGVFNPYTQVKTSIIFVDKNIAKKADSILFLTITSDGTDLGAQRRNVETNDLPLSIKALKSYAEYIENNDKDFNVDSQPCEALLVSKSKISEDGVYILSSERYRTINSRHQKWKMAELQEFCRIEKGKSSSSKTKPGDYPLVLTAKERKTADHYDFEGSAVLIPLISSTGHGKAVLNTVHRQNGKFAAADLLAVIFPDEKVCLYEYLFHCLDSIKQQIAKNKMSGAANVSMKLHHLNDIQIPLPPIEIQRQIVDEISAHQRIIDGARQVVDVWKPIVELDDEFEKVKISEVTDFIDYRGKTPNKSSNGVRLITAKNVKMGFLTDEPKEYIADYDSWMTRGIPKKGDVLFTTEGPLGNVAIIDIDDEKFAVGQRIITLQSKDEIILPVYLANVLMSPSIQAEIEKYSTGSTVKGILARYFREIEIPLPPLEIQREIVARIEIERAIVHGNRELIRLYEEKVKKVIERVWEG